MITSNNIEDILRELRAIKEFPSSIAINGWALTLSNKDEAVVFMAGLEIGSALSKESKT